MVILQGTPVSEGVAIGRPFCWASPDRPGGEAHFQGDAAPYLEAFQKALGAADQELAALIASFPAEQNEQAQIFSAHREILADEELTEGVREKILRDRATPAYAVEQTLASFAALVEGQPDPLIAARGADLRDVQRRLLRALGGEGTATLSLPEEPVILVARDLLPSDTAALDRTRVIGIVTELGGETSHTAILARSFQIPAITGVKDAAERLRDVGECILDGTEGRVILSPGREARLLAQKRRAAIAARRGWEASFGGREARTADGVRIEIGVNTGGEDLPEAGTAWDWVGLFRTEFLYMNRNHLPAEEEQYAAYRQVLRQAGGKPVTLRTLDIGGDKQLPYMELPKEENPFLGKRALRLCLERRDLFRTQLRSALRAAAEGPLQLMFPMVGSMDDLRRAKAALAEAKAALRAEGAAFDPDIKTGIMIEVPSIALIADLAAQEVDFASIGTNDLCQYTMAVDRMAPDLRAYYQCLSPAMLRLLRMVVSAFTKAGKPISVCGEMGSDPIAAAALVGLGVRKLSMSAGAIPKIKAALSQVKVSEAEEAVRRGEQSATETAVREELSKLFGGS